MSCTNLALGLFDRIWNGVTSVRQQKLSAQNYLRAYYLEVKSNLELLAILKEDAFKGKSPDDPGFIAFIRRLQVQVAASILFDEGKGGNAVFVRLQKESNGALLRNISFTVSKILLLQSLADFNDEERDLLKGVQLHTRLDHVEGRLTDIIKNLAEAGGVQELFNAA